MLPRAARVRFCDQQGDAAAHQARPAQARGDLEHRGRPEAHGRAARRAPKRSASAMTARTLEFFKTYDLLLAPATIVRAVSDRAPLCRRMRRQEVRQLRRMARHRLRDHAGVLPGAVAALRVHRVRPAGRPADGRRRRAARRSCSPARRCWRIFWACAARRRSIRGSRDRRTSLCAATAGPTRVEQTGRDGVLLQPPICGNRARAGGRAEPNVTISIVRESPT